MTEQEIQRRLRALLAMPLKERPFPLMALVRLTGIRADHLSAGANKRDGMYRSKRRALERAFTLLENGQAEMRKTWKCKGPYVLTVREDAPPCPKQSMLTRIRMTDTGPVLDFVAVNKSAFPVLPRVFK